MRPGEFIDAVYATVYRAAIDGVMRLLAHPPGRRPRADLQELSLWFNALDETGREHVQNVARLSVDQAVFGMLSALDGSRSLGEGVDLTLQSGKELLTGGSELHDLFRTRVDQEVGHD